MPHKHATIPFFPMQPDSVRLAKTYNLLRGLGQEISYGFAERTYDIIQNAVRGVESFDVDQGNDFNHAAYEMAAKRNESISKTKKVKKEVHIMEDADASENEGVAYGYVKASSAIALEDVYEATEGLVALPDLVEQLRGLKTHVETEHRIDLMIALKGALNGEEGCAVVLKELRLACPKASQMLQDLLTSVVEARSANLGELDFLDYLEQKGL